MHAIAHAQPTRAPDVQQAQRPPHRLNLMMQRKPAPQALPPKPAGRCACGGGCPACQARLQAKLVIGPVNDPLEREADHIAGMVTAPGALTSPVQPSSTSSCPLQRACACGGSCGCGKTSEDEEPLQRQASENRTPDRVPALVDTVLATGGMPLPESIRTEFGPRFGQDFSGVRVHADPIAAQSAAEVQALAYTVGRDIVFGAGQFSPESASGRRLIAHELTHVVQQGAAASMGRTSSPAISRQALPGQIIQRQPAPVHRTSPISSGVPSEKWREDAESAYRRAGLSVAANAVRNCREWNDCENLLTTQEAWNAYKTGRISANLGAPPESGPGKSAVNGGVAMAGVAAAPLLAQGGGTAPLLAEGGAAAAKTLAERRLLAWGVAETVPLLVPEAAAATTAAPAAVTGTAAAGVSTVAIPIAVGVVLVLAVIDLVGWARFQGKLESLGYIILPDPLATCIQNCHTAPARTPQPRWDPDLFPRRDPFAPIDPDRIKDWLDKTAPKPAPKPTPTPTPTPVPVPKPEPEKKRRRKCRGEPCESPLPVTWPMALPLPYTSPRRLTRQNAGDREWEGIERGAPQRRMAEEIRRARERLVPPPNPCFTHDAEPNAPYDAHHTHPLYLGGEEAEYNLCALRADRHQLGHPSLDNQTEHLEVYMECGICSGFLSQHPRGQDYVIVGRK